MKFHEFVTSRRIRFNLDRQELAKQAHISDVHLRHIENGGQIPEDMTILSNLADALQVDRKWFRDFAYMKSELFTDVSRQEE